MDRGPMECSGSKTLGINIDNVDRHRHDTVEGAQVTPPAASQRGGIYIYIYIYIERERERECIMHTKICTRVPM